MSVSTTTNRIAYTGNGALTVYAYNFKIFAQTDLEVYVAGVKQTLTTHYTVSGVGDAAGGNVTFVSAPANLASIVIIRVLPATQLTVYPSNDKFPAKVHEDLADRAVMLLQQQAEVDKRALKLPVTSLFSDLSVSDPSTGKFLRWKDATGLENADITSGGTLGLPVSFADGGTGASYASRQALVQGLRAAQWKFADSSLTPSAGVITLPDPLTGNLFVVNAGNISSIAGATSAIEGAILGFVFGASATLTHSSGLRLQGAASSSAVANGDRLFFLYEGGGIWQEVLRIKEATATHASLFWRGDGSWQGVTGDFVKGLNMRRHASTATKVTFESALRIQMVDGSGGTHVVSNPSTFDVDTATAGPAAGGRDQAGAFSNGATVHVYAIRNGATIAGLVSLNGPSVGPAALPSGYTHYAYLSTYVLVSGTTNFPLHRVRGSRVYYESQQSVLSGGVATSETAVVITGFVPATALAFAVRAMHTCTITISADSGLSLRYVTGAEYVSGQLKGTNGGSDSYTLPVEIPNVSQTLFYLTSSQATANTVDIHVLGYQVPNGGE